MEQGERGRRRIGEGVPMTTLRSALAQLDRYVPLSGSRPFDTTTDLMIP